jgi:hypothetical protein
MTKSTTIIVFLLLLAISCAPKPTFEQEQNVDFDKIYGGWISVGYYFDKKITKIDTLKNKPIKIKVGTMFLRIRNDGTYLQQTCSVESGKFSLDRKNYNLIQICRFENKDAKSKWELQYLDNDCLLLYSNKNNVTHFFKRYEPKSQ